MNMEILGGAGRFYWGRREAQSKGIIVGFAWMSSDDKHLKPDAKLYASLGWNSLICHANFLNMFVTNVGPPISRYHATFPQFAGADVTVEPSTLPFTRRNKKLSYKIIFTTKPDPVVSAPMTSANIRSHPLARIERPCSGHIDAV